VWTSANHLQHMLEGRITVARIASVHVLIQMHHFMEKRTPGMGPPVSEVIVQTEADFHVGTLAPEAEHTAPAGRAHPVDDPWLRQVAMKVTVIQFMEAVPEFLEVLRLSSHGFTSFWP